MTTSPSSRPRRRLHWPGADFLVPGALLTALLATCATATATATAPPPAPPASRPIAEVDVPVLLQTIHRDGDDLLTAGLGETGLRAMLAPGFADPAAPTAAELRRRAIWTNWRGIADLSPGSGYGRDYGSLAPVPGREFHGFATLPGRKQPHRVLLQLPDSFDPQRRCLVVAASSGSRGIYGAIALAGAWGLARGCAVAYTDKGAGTGYVDAGDGIGTAIDGRRAGAGEAVEFTPAPTMVASAGAPPAVFVKHAHSGDNPEADWGLHVRQAAVFATQVLQSQFPGEWNAATTTVIATGVSNGGGAVLRAAELPGDWLDGVVAISPNVLPARGGRALFDYVSEAALLMPCALNAKAYDDVALARPGGAKNPAGVARCASLHAADLLAGDDAQAQAEDARRRLLAQRWTDDAIAAGAISTTFELWRAVAVTYAAAYERSGSAPMPCGYAFATVGADGRPVPATDALRATWWSDASGIPPSAGIGIVDTRMAGADPLLPGLMCLRALWDGDGSRLHAGVAATRAGLPRANLPVIVVHGGADGLVPEAFAGGAYVRWAEAGGRQMTYWRIADAQHFDAFVALPALAGRYRPLLPEAYRALDAMWESVTVGKRLPDDGER